MKIHLYVAAVLPLMSMHALAEEGSWYRESYHLKAGDALLDTYTSDPGGHAAPFLADLDGDGRRDLTVGSLWGKFHFYKNVGTDAQPRFAAKPVPLLAGISANEPARVPNYCCVAAGPQLRDVDGDGVLDLAAGSYGPGAAYWFKGKGNGTFHARQMLTDSYGLPVLAMPEANPYNTGEDFSGNAALNLAWTDWDDNGSPDLILGNAEGRLFVRLNIAGEMEGSVLPLAGQPEFAEKQSQKFNEITIDGGVAVPGGHAAPAVADWDGDGLWDILAGSRRGEVYWFRNTGKPGAPVFKERKKLLDAGHPVQWVKAGETPGHGIRTQIQAVDYNLDGKMDLLVGEWSDIRSARPDLSAAQQREMQRVQKALKALDAQVQFDEDTGSSRYKYQNYIEHEPLLKQAQSLEKQLTPFLVRYSEAEIPEYRLLSAYRRCTGYVWVYLRT